MMHYSAAQIILFFLIYSIAGWICEVIYCSVPKREFVNRGFFYGPYCPIYGTGALVILLIAEPFRDHIVVLFCVSMVMTTIIEYITGWLMEEMFQMKWWDYSNQKFQIKGRICLKNSILFGLLSIVLTYVIHPPVASFVSAMPVIIQRICVLTALIILIVDLAFTLDSLSKMKVWLTRAHRFIEELKQYDKVSEWLDKAGHEISFLKIKEMIKKETGTKSKGLFKQLEQLTEWRKPGFRFAKAFPNLKPAGMEKAMKLFHDAREEWKKKKKTDES